MSKVSGLDVSKYAGTWKGGNDFEDTTDYQKVADAGYKFVYIRAAYGADYVDPLFLQHWNGYKEVGLLRGAYHFCRAHQPVDDQISIMVDTVPEDDRGELPPWYDLERWRLDPVVKGRPLVDFSEAYMLGVESVWGNYMDVYVNAYFWEENLRVNLQYPKWYETRGLALAQWPYGIPTNPWKLPKGWNDEWVWWQYRGDITIDGIEGACDLDFFNGTHSELLAYAGQPIPPDNHEELWEAIQDNQAYIEKLKSWAGGLAFPE